MAISFSRAIGWLENLSLRGQKFELKRYAAAVGKSCSKADLFIA
jgi:hypothetical protein